MAVSDDILEVTESIQDYIARQSMSQSTVKAEQPSLSIKMERMATAVEPQAHKWAIVKADIHTPPSILAAMRETQPNHFVRPVTFAKIRDADAIEVLSSEKIPSNNATSLVTMELSGGRANAPNRSVTSVIEVDPVRSSQSSSQQDVSTNFDFDLDQTLLDNDQTFVIADIDADDDVMKVQGPSTTDHDDKVMGPPTKLSARGKAKKPTTPKVTVPRKARTSRKAAEPKRALASTVPSVDVDPFAFVDDNDDNNSGRRRSGRATAKKTKEKIRQVAYTERNGVSILQKAQRQAAKSRELSAKTPTMRGSTKPIATITSASTSSASTSPAVALPRKRSFFDPIAYNTNIEETDENDPKAPPPPKRRTLQRPRQFDEGTTASFDSDAMQSSQSKMQRASLNLQRMNAASNSTPLQPIDPNISEFDRLRTTGPVQRNVCYSYRQAAQTTTTTTTILSQQVMPFDARKNNDLSLATTAQVSNEIEVIY